MKTALAHEPLPAGYPKELERWVTLDDGRKALIRPVVPEDSSTLMREFERADEETIYQRFFRAPVRLNPEQLDRLTRVDYERRLALAVLSPDGNGVAIARYETLEPGVAEVAVVVHRDWRGHGLASLLLQLLEQAAVERGIHHFTALYLPDNDAIVGVLQRVGFTTGLDESSVAGAEKRLGPTPS